mgnify:CR=1 FL=1
MCSLSSLSLSFYKKRSKVSSDSSNNDDEIMQEPEANNSESERMINSASALKDNTYLAS